MSSCQYQQDAGKLYRVDYRNHQKCIKSMGFLLEFGIVALQLISHQQVRVHLHLMLLYLQNYETGHWLHHQCAECARHRPWVYEVYPIVVAEFQLVRVSADQHLHSHLDCLVAQCFLVAPWNYLMAVDDAHLQSPDFYNFLLGQILEALVFEIALDDMEVVGERLGPVVHFPGSHIASADNGVDLIGGDHFPVLGRDLGSTVGNMEIAQHQHQHAHLLFVCHLVCCILLIDFVSKYIQPPFHSLLFLSILSHFVSRRSFQAYRME